MSRRKKKRPAPSRPADPWRDRWAELTPSERLRRSWKLRRLLPDPQAVHDAKTLPQL